MINLSMNLFWYRFHVWKWNYKTPNSCIMKIQPKTFKQLQIIRDETQPRFKFQQKNKLLLIYNFRKPHKEILKNIIL